MFKTLFFLLLLGLMFLVGCRGGEPFEIPERIGILTGTASQGEEEFIAARQMIDRFGRG